MELGLLSNSSINPSVYWTTLLPPLFSGLSRQPGVRTISPPPLAWERREEWRRVRSEIKACDTLFRAQLGSRPTGAIHLASYLNLRARRSNYVLDAWKPSLTKIGIAATLERLDPCFVAYREARDELESRFPLAKFVWLPFGAHTDVFYPRKEQKSIFAFWMGRRHEPLHRALLAYCEAARPALRLFERRPIEHRGARTADLERPVLPRHAARSGQHQPHRGVSVRW